MFFSATVWRVICFTQSFCKLGVEIIVTYCNCHCEPTRLITLLMLKMHVCGWRFWNLYVHRGAHCVWPTALIVLFTVCSVFCRTSNKCLLDTEKLLIICFYKTSFYTDFVPGVIMSGCLYKVPHQPADPGVAEYFLHSQISNIDY